MNAYATHLPVLRALADLDRWGMALEFGTGKFSTPLIAANADCLLTIEQQASGYAEWARRQYASLAHVTVEYLPGAAAMLGRMASLGIAPDFVFVDGAADCRVPAVNYALDHWPGATVVAHDTEAEGMYGWRMVRALDGVLSATCSLWRPTTTAWSRNYLATEAVRNITATSPATLAAIAAGAG